MSTKNNTGNTSNTNKTQTVDFFENLGNKAIWFALGIATLIVLYVYWDFITLKKAFLFKDIGSDSINEAWPLFYHLADQWTKNGIIYWSHNFGLGDTLFQFYGDPFNFIMIMSGKENFPVSSVLCQIMAILLTVVFSFKHLKLLKLNNFTAIFGSLTFAFSGYIILTSSGWLMAPQFFYFTLGLYAVEAFLNNKKVLPIVITAILLGFYNAIIGIQIFMFLSFYFLIRQIELNQFKMVIKSILTKQVVFTIVFVLGFLVAGLCVLNYLDLVLTSGRALITSKNTSLSSTSLFTLMPGDELSSLIARSFSNDLLGSGANYKGWMNYLESPLTYVGLVPLLLSFYGVFYGEKNDVKMHRFLLILVIVGFAFPYIRYAFWGFQLNYFRIYSMFLGFFLFFIGIRTFNKIIVDQFISKKFIYISFVIVLIILFGNNVIPKELINNSVRMIVFLLIVSYYVLWFFISKERSLKEIKFAFIILLVLELTLFTNKTVNNRVHITGKELKQKVGFFDTTVDELSYLKTSDPGNYRIAKMYFSGPAMHGSLNDALIQDYMGLVSYSQFQKKGYLDFLTLAGMFNQEDPNELKWSSKLLNDLNLAGFLGTKYILYKQPYNYDSTFLKRVKTFGDYGILKNSLYVPLFFTQQRAISKTEMMKRPDNLRRLMFFYDVAVDDAEVANYAPAKTDSSMFRIDTLLKQVAYLNKGDVIVDEFKPNQIKLTANVTGNSIICSSIPNHDGWKVFMDEKPVDKLIINGGLIGIKATSGKHQVRLAFEPPKLKTGKMVSLIAIVSLLLLLIVELKFKFIRKVI